MSDVVVYPWVGLAAPQATPKDILAKLSSEIRTIVADSEIANRFIGLGMEPIANTPDAFALFIDGEVKRWQPLIKSLGISLQ